MKLQNKVNSLSDAREFYDPESGSSSGATHVPDLTSAVRGTRTCLEGLSSTIFNNSKNSASFFQGLRPGTAETARKRDSEMKRESLNTSVLSPHFQSKSGMLNHTGGTYSHGGIMVYTRFHITEWNLGKFLDSMEFQSWRVNFRTKIFSKTAAPHLTMPWIKEVEIAKSINDLVTSRSIMVQRNFPDYDMIDTMIASAALKKLFTHVHFRKRVSVEEQHFSCNRSLRSSTRTLRFVQFSLTD